MFGEYNAVTLTMYYLKVPPQNSYINFSKATILLEQRFCRTRVSSSIKFFIQQLIGVVVLNFYIDLFPPFYCLKWNYYFSTFVPVLACIIYPLFMAGSMNYVTASKISANTILKNFLNAWGFWVPKWNIEKHLADKY